MASSLNTASIKAVIFLITFVSVEAKDECDFPIRRRLVLSTWQSSFGDGPTCFYDRSSSDEESVLNEPTRSHRFFYSADKSQADGGFHWFAVQLKEPELVRSVTVKGREDREAYLFNRVIGIEIWTSSWSGQIFSGDHCSCQSMSSQFHQSVSRWTLCGVINRTLGSISAGENITVGCINGTREIRHLLVRRNVSSKAPETEDDFMSFADLRLQTVQLVTSAPTHIAQNSIFTVSCSWNCSSGADLSRLSSQLQLCLPSGSCTAGSQLQIGRARPEHSGNYTCRLGYIRSVAAAVTVLYPPSMVSISVQNPDSCHNLSDVIVQFSSSAAEPVPQHSCRVIPSRPGLKFATLTRLLLSSSGDGSVSLWKLDTESQFCQSTQQTVACTAGQTLPSGIHFPSKSAQAEISCQGTSNSQLDQKLAARVVPYVVTLGLSTLTFMLGFLTALALVMRHRCCPNSCWTRAVGRSSSSQPEQIRLQGELAQPEVVPMKPKNPADEYENSEYKLENSSGIYVA